MGDVDWGAGSNLDNSFFCVFYSYFCIVLECSLGKDKCSVLVTASGLAMAVCGLLELGLLQIVLHYL